MNQRQENSLRNQFSTSNLSSNVSLIKSGLFQIMLIKDEMNEKLFKIFISINLTPNFIDLNIFAKVSGLETVALRPLEHSFQCKVKKPVLRYL